MPRPRKYRVNRDRSKVTKSGPKTRNLVECKCLLHCGGSKLNENDDEESERNDNDELERNDDDENDNETDNEPIDGPKR
ncbi:hypothetical protein RIR_jg26911.t1 [Rhizophagus irregularis DAOM 181602=DAOM 197198]|nr:hypothetical protein RIR_jg26911.t1 [Rhizophagus irregularis DAOM 181602=DAOM 197198]